MRTSRSVVATASVAALVTVAGMLYAFVQRPSSGDNQPGAAELRCGGAVCQSVVGLGVDKDHVEVLVGGGSGRIKVTSTTGNAVIFDLPIAEAGAQVNGSSLTCVAGTVSICLVQGPRDNEVLGQALVRRGGVWEAVPQSYLATGAHLKLNDVNRDGIGDVVAVQLTCGDCKSAYYQVFWEGRPDTRCSAPAPTKDQLPGWPGNPVPAVAQLRPCPG